MGFKRLALDANAFYAGVPFGTSDTTSYVTTRPVYYEVSHIKRHYGALSSLLAAKRLSIYEPDKTFVDAARRAALKTGDIPNLSKPDLTLIALCIAERLDLVTDDYALSNVMQDLGLHTISVMTGGITNVLQWQYYCPGCGVDRDCKDPAGAGRHAYTGSSRDTVHFKHGSSRRSGKKHHLERQVCNFCGTTLKRRVLNRRKARDKRRTG